MKYASKRAITPDFAFSARSRGCNPGFGMMPLQSFFGVFEGIAVSFPLSELEPEIQRFLKPQANCSEEEPC